MNNGLGFLYEPPGGGDYDYGSGDDYDSGAGGYDLGGGLPFAEYVESWPIEEPNYGYVDLPTFSNDPWFVDPGYGATDPIQEYRNWWEGYDPLEAPLETIATQEQYPVRLPDVGNWSWLPVPDTYWMGDPWESPPYVNIPDVSIPPPPEYPSQQSNLPPACPGGSYHPYPIGHPQQNICVPFPETPTSTPKPKPQTAPPGSSSGGSSGSKSQQQQPSCPTYCKHPQTGQWFKTPAGYHCAPGTQVCTPNAQQQQTCPSGQVRNPSTGQCVAVPQCQQGTVFDARAGRCVPFSQAQQPLCPPGYTPNYNTKRCEVAPQCAPGLVFDQVSGFCVQPSAGGELDDVLNSLKTIPWWVWAALGGAFLLSRNEDGRTTTVRYRRAS